MSFVGGRSLGAIGPFPCSVRSPHASCGLDYRDSIGQVRCVVACSGGANAVWLDLAASHTALMRQGVPWGAHCHGASHRGN